MAMLEIKDLEVFYGVIQAIKGVSFEVGEGEVIALIGANGAGKTTILHTITGLIQAKSGHVFQQGRNHGAFSRAEREKSTLHRGPCLCPGNREDHFKW